MACVSKKTYITFRLFPVLGGEKTLNLTLHKLTTVFVIVKGCWKPSLFHEESLLVLTAIINLPHLCNHLVINTAPILGVLSFSLTVQLSLNCTNGSYLIYITMCTIQLKQCLLDIYIPSFQWGVTSADYVSASQ